MATRSKTLFAEMTSACGLSQAEVAALTDRSLSGIQKMYLGASVPDDVLDALAFVFASIETRGEAPDMPEGARARREAILALRRRKTTMKGKTP